MQYYGTLGPACGQVAVLEKMFEAGMTGVRMNMSHGNLDENGHWLEMLFEAADRYWAKQEEGTGWPCKYGVTRKLYDFSLAQGTE